jgi:XTP/dITP diphosphohydrolase
MSSTLVVATANEGKAVEIRRFLGEASIEVHTLVQYPDIVMPEEVGDTFAENARLKAEHVRRELNVAALADDSGLVVDALGGAPGVRSARYAPGDDAARYVKLLCELEDVPEEARQARFVCAMAFAPPTGELICVEGRTEGRIALAPRGTGGFGYDPVFLLPDGRTMAELCIEEKNRISHRGRALFAMRPHFLAHFSLE